MPNNLGKDPTQLKRLLLAVSLSAAILLGFDLVSMKVFGRHALASFQPSVAEKAQTPENAQGGLPKSAFFQQPGVPSVGDKTPEILHLALSNARMLGEVATQGGQLDKLRLKPIPGEIRDEKGYTLLRPFTDPSSSYVAAGWTGAVEGPTETSVWQPVPQPENSGKVVLVWQNKTGQLFERTFMPLPDSYVVDVTDKVTNAATLPVSLSPYIQVRHAGGFAANERSSWVNMFGPMGTVTKMEDGHDKGFIQYEDKYADLKKAGTGETVSGSGGWWGITSQYFMAAVMPETVNGQDMPSTRQFKYDNVSGRDFYTASVTWPGVVVPTGGKAEVHYQLYVGPKHYPQLASAGHYLERAISWGWFEPLVKGLYAILVWLYDFVGNWGLAVIGITMLLKLVTFPLANKSYHSMAKMRKLQPKMEELKARLKGDQQALGLEMMKLYQKEKVNPLSGCWPMLIQVPIFFAMYKVVLVMFEFRQAPLGLWITDMSLKDPYYVLPVLMGISMYVQFKLNPPPSDPTQAAMFKWMPVFMTVMFLSFPSGLVLYWFVSNVLSIIQQAIIMRKDKAI